jgi:hypothetical protein
MLIQVDSPTTPSFREPRCRANISQQKARITFIQIPYMRWEIEQLNPLNEINLMAFTQPWLNSSWRDEIVGRLNHTQMTPISTSPVLYSLTDCGGQSIRGGDSQSIEWKRVCPLQIRAEKVDSPFR